MPVRFRVRWSGIEADEPAPGGKGITLLPWNTCGDSTSGCASILQLEVSVQSALFSECYDDMLRLARRELRRVAGGRLGIDENALVHETYIVLRERDGLAFDAAGALTGYAARVMHGLLSRELRKHMAQKRGVRLRVDTPDIEQLAAPTLVLDGGEVREALRHLEGDDAELAKLILLKTHYGYSLGEIAAALKLSRRTVERRWAEAVRVMRLILFP
jgi:RNA polymerase sigma factor (sigma-70 family)